MNIHSKIKYKDARIGEIIGTGALMLTDPITDRVCEKYDFKNHAFKDVILSLTVHSSYNGVAYPWATQDLNYGVNAAALVLGDSDKALDVDFPIVRGQVIGYGKPSLGSAGLYRGAYNAANQVLGEMTSTKARWKFQYDFTQGQAVGTIRNLGLTRQYDIGRFVTQDARYYKNNNAAYYSTSDGAAAYRITTAGVVEKKSFIDGFTMAYIDKSAVVGNNAVDYKMVGYAPRTGKYYIMVCSATSGNRKIYEFSDNTFDTLLNTYILSNFTLTSAPYYSTEWLYIYDNYAYFGPENSIVSRIRRVNFIANTAIETLSIPETTNNCITQESTASQPIALQGSFTIGDVEGILFMYGVSMNYPGIYDPDTNSFPTRWLYSYGSGQAGYANHTEAKRLPCVYATGESYYLKRTAYHNAALTSHILTEPFVKPSNKGMTVTYELEVYWE